MEPKEPTEQPKPIQAQTVLFPLPGISNPPFDSAAWLRDRIEKTTNESNRAEGNVAKQVLLVASAALAVVGSLSSDTFTGLHSTTVRTLLTYAVILLSASIVTGILGFCMEFYYWQDCAKKLADLNNTMSNEPEPQRLNNLKIGMLSLKKQSFRGFFWAQIATFVASVLVLTTLILIKLHS